MSEEVKYTPMMMQYLEEKKKYQDCIVFYRLGDFYEMFFDDAKTAAQELDLVLTGRNAGVEERVPMCGIPYHAANGYIQRLTQKGYKVAIIEQLEEPTAGKIVQRGCIKIVTPGTWMEEGGDEKESYFIASIADTQFGLSIVYCEITTGECYGQQADRSVQALTRLCLSKNVREIVVSTKFDAKFKKVIEDLNITLSTNDNFYIHDVYEPLVSHIDDEGIQNAFAQLTNYLEETQKTVMSHLSKVEMISEEETMQMDFSTRQNLELTQTLRANSKSQTLWSFLDHCESAMGSRMLRRWIEAPLIDLKEINKREDAIDYLNGNFIVKDELKEYLSNVYDLERLCARVAISTANPRDCVRLAQTLSVIPKILDIIQDCKPYAYLAKCDPCQPLYEKLKGAFVDQPSVHVKDGNVFVVGYDEELDEYRRLGKSGQEWILEFEAKEREKTQIKNLKVGYNRVFGYYIEVSKGNVPLVKDEYGYVRKQTLTNCERYVTQELKDHEDAILHAQERAIRREVNLFNELIAQIKSYLPKLHECAHACAIIDCLYSLAVVSNENGYIRPIFTDKHEIEVIDGRHPILEKMLKGNRYIPNSLVMKENENVNIITGPNMGGKSTFMRQMASIVILAQIGCFVPAKKALLPVFDKIFTRIGASDDIMSGQSTFMVEMMEANQALTHATENSLILFDEIGRGTSTYDGMSLAHAMIEYINQTIHAKTLFSTHYHELTALEEEYDSIRNLHVEVHEENDHVTFLYKVLPGKADKSYGINVARLAKLPESILERANQILAGLENQTKLDLNLAGHYEFKKEENVFEKQLCDQIAQMDVDALSPKQALEYLYKLQEKLNQR
ncbi:DNA mismatch repair protein MutS [Traorella massiliensis]|uniref:DNA mismatch repair protein MutS n=1 Tax=Traorella massiliensis TaxID=1903263 RepID=UPI0008F7F63F|nr:DNA mismatch repair protein MutS [Traorella massiliensis]